MKRPLGGEAATGDYDGAPGTKRSRLVLPAEADDDTGAEEPGKHYPTFHYLDPNPMLYPSSY